MATKDFNVLLFKSAGALALVLMMAACSSDGDSRAELRRLAGVVETPSAATSLPSPTAIPQPEPTETPDFGNPQPAITAQPVIKEVTRQVVDVQQVEVTRIVEVMATPMPDIQGFSDMPVIDESTQPCPAGFWKRGRCTATQAQIEQTASEVQP